MLAWEPVAPASRHTRALRADSLTMHRTHRGALVLFTAITFACGAPPTAPNTSKGRSSADPAARAGSAPPDPGAASEEPDTPRVVPDARAAVERALEERRLGHLEKARAILADADLEVGAADTSGTIYRARGGVAGIAFSAWRGSGTTFFDATTGEPIGLVSNAVFSPDERESPNVQSPGIFVGSADTRHALYDGRNARLLTSGPATKVTKDGATAYVASQDQCAWSQWDLLTGQLVGDLEAIASGCERTTSHATLTDDGKALIGAAWWDLDTRNIRQMPSGPAIFYDYAVALSPDQNHVAYVLAGPPQLEPPAWFVTVVDRRTGKQTLASEPIRSLSNADPLDFAEAPLRVVVTDYGQWAFGVPSLQLLAKHDGSANRTAMTTAPARVQPTPPSAPTEAETAPLRALLTAATCSRGGFIVPLDLCAAP